MTLIAAARLLATGNERVESRNGAWSLGAAIWLERLTKRARGRVSA